MSVRSRFACATLIAASLVACDRDEVIVSVNDRDPVYFDLVRVNLATGEQRRIFENREFASVYVDRDFALRYAAKQTADGGQELFVRDGDRWRSWSAIPQEDALTTDLAGFTADGKTLYMRDSRDRNTGAYAWVAASSPCMQCGPPEIVRSTVKTLGGFNRSEQHHPLTGFDMEVLRYGSDGAAVAAELQQGEVWRRWKQGEAFSEIGRALGKTRQTVATKIVKRGGLAPHERRRGARACG